MDDPQAGDAPGPGDAPGERRLARPPSERYATPPGDAPSEGVASGASDARSRIALVALLVLVSALLITVLGGLLAITAGLLVIAGAIGWAIAAVLPPMSVVARRRPLAITVAALAVGLGQIGLWLLARQEGGTLGLVEYLAETFGILVPLQLVIAAVFAWWQAR